MYQITLDRRPEALAYSAGNGVARGLAHVVDVLDVLPGPAGIAPASRRRPPTRSGPRRALGFVQRRRALSNAAELRDPVARGLAHARQTLQLERSSIELRRFRTSGSLFLTSPRFSLPIRRCIVAEATVGASGGRVSNPLPGVHNPLCRSPYTTPYAGAVGEIRTPDPLVRSEVLSIR